MKNIRAALMSAQYLDLDGKAASKHNVY